jgi:type I restriction enzyme M protein
VPHPPPGDDPLLRRSQIAVLAGVSRPTVTAWQKHEGDFPSPRRSNGQDYFRRSEVLDWLDRRPVPRARLVGQEEPGITYGRRARSRMADDRSSMASPYLTYGDVRRPPRPAVTLPDPDDQRVVGELMGKLVDRVRGAASVIDYMNLLFSLHYLRGVGGSRWRALRDAATTINGLDVASELLRDIGRAADEDMRRFAVDTSMEEALGRLEPRTARDLRQVVDAVSRLREEAFGLILDEYEQHAALGSGEFFTPRAVVRLMARLACTGYGPGRPLSVYDPYARGGEFLIEAAVACASGADDTPSPVSVRAQGETRRADTWRLASMNLALHGVTPELELRRTAPWEGDARRRPLSPADIVLTNPPFNMSDSAREERREGRWPYGAPPVDNDNFAYVQHCLTMLREGGRAGIIMPNKAGNSGHKAEREIRGNLIDGGVVECVIALPTQLFTGTAVPVSAWLLRHPGDPCDQVLFLDASRLGVKSGSRRVLGEQDIQSLLDICGVDRPGGREAADPGAGATDGSVPSALVSRNELRARDYSLNPLDHIQRDGGGEEEPETALAIAWKELTDLKERLLETQEVADTLPYMGFQASSAHRESGRGVSVPLATVCEIQAGPSYSMLGKAQRTADGDVPVVFPRHLKGGHISETQDELISAKTARQLARFSLWEGDIVCIRSGAIGPPALVRSGQAGWLMSPNVIRLRVKERARVLPEYLLYYLCRDEAVDWMRDRAAATAAPSIRTESLGNLKIPLPALREQRAIAATLVGLDELDRMHQQLAASVRHARTVLADALMSSPPSLPDTSCPATSETRRKRCCD